MNPVRALLRLVIAASFSSLAMAAQAACPDPVSTPPQRIRLQGETAMLVTHASESFDPRMSTKHGLDAAIRFARERAIPRIYLADDEPGNRYFMDDCEPDYWAESEDGELRFELPASRVILAGGHLELCLSRTMHQVLEQWARRPARQLTMILPMDAIYSNGKQIDESDPYFESLQRFLGVATHGRPGGETWPKLTLLETMGVIARKSDQLTYLRRVLPHFERTLPAFRVEMRVNGADLAVLQRGLGSRPSTLRFEYVDTANRIGQID